MRAALWALLLALLVLLVQSALWTPRLALPLRITVVAIGVTAALTPRVALLGLALLVPCAHVLVTRVFSAYPFEFAEAMLLAFFAGYLWASRRDWVDQGAGDDAGLRWPSLAFGLVVVTSCVVQVRTLQLWQDDPGRYAASFVRFLQSGYLTDALDPRPSVDGRGFLRAAALLVESIALMRVTRTLCRATPDLGRHLVAALVAAGTVGALLSFPDPIEAARARRMGLVQILMHSRWSSWTLPSINTSGAYFLLVGFLALSLAASVVRGAFAALVAAALAFVAMWLTGTRAAMVAGLVVVAAGSVVGFVARRSGRSPGWIVGVALLGAAVFAGLLVAINPMGVFRTRIRQSLEFRVLFAETGLRMFASAPLTGIGIGQFPVRYREFAPAELKPKYPQLGNPHNYPLWILVETGLIGLAAFAWLAAAIVRTIARNVRGDPDRRRLLLVAGLAAFAMTCLTGQPLDINTAAVPFWMAVGVALVGPSAPSEATVRRPLIRPFGAAAVAAVAVALVATLPARLEAAERLVDFTAVTYGFDGGDTTRRDDRPFRWAGPRATFFQSSTVSGIDVPLSAQDAATKAGLKVTLSVDGRPVRIVTVGYEQWEVVRLRPAAEAWRSSRYWRVDLVVEPADAAAIPEGHQRVAVGAITSVPGWQLEP